ncbi:MAG TPA: Rnase Y domain-containing protein, partial [Isosphaeraceae bacterium]|nr:Rnase Y domain-containing protein [Isosphaeraceae bacterium]
MGAFGLGVFGGLIVGMVGGLAGALLIARFRAQTARGLAEQIVANANREAETIRRQADLQAKEEALSRRETLESEVDKVRRDLREHERRVEKREDLLEQKVELLNKRERECETLERGLTVQQDKLCQTDQQLRRNLAEQLDVLQRIGHFSAEEARDMLLRRVEEELGGEVGSRVLKYE